MIVSFSALGSIGGLLLGNPRPFAVKYTIGNLLSLGSSSFLVGPAKQCRDMLAPERFLASTIYFATLFGTLFSAFWLKIQIVTFAFVLVQFAALTWYMLSYVPYGQARLKRTVKKASQERAREPKQSARPTSPSARGCSSCDKSHRTPPPPPPPPPPPRRGRRRRLARLAGLAAHLPPRRRRR